MAYKVSQHLLPFDCAPLLTTRPECVGKDHSNRVDRVGQKTEERWSYNVKCKWEQLVQLTTCTRSEQWDKSNSMPEDGRQRSEQQYARRRKAKIIQQFAHRRSKNQNSSMPEDGRKISYNCMPEDGKQRSEQQYARKKWSKDQKTLGRRCTIVIKMFCVCWERSKSNSANGSH